MSVPKQFNITAYWGARPDTPENMAVRFRIMLRRMAGAHPELAHFYFYGQDRPILLDQRMSGLTELIAERVSRDDFGKPEPIMGYSFGGAQMLEFSPRIISILGMAGMDFDSPCGYFNKVHLETCWKYPPDPDIVTYSLFRSFLLAIALAWDVTWCSSYSTGLMKLWPKKGGPHFRLGWMTYIAARFVPLVQLTPDIDAEFVEGGGLLMTATRETFDVANPAHVAASEAIQTAIAGFNALPWPPDPKQPRPAE